ncbi:MAG TPA: alpha/beta hydrolase [Thermoanaerobaculia bacterium]|nr:alpha/beta hydrolase [Thermoanaerobaculia bacterium]
MRLLALLALLAALPAASLELKPCRLPDFDREARCGTHEVFENRTAAAGRKIPLHVVVIPASGAPVQPDPVVYFEGGPGGSAVESGPGLTEELATALRNRDLVLIDVRGTGASGPLNCPKTAEVALESFMDPAMVRSCRETLARDHDLSQYTTEAIVDDVDEVRAALGYAKVNLLGASYGTRAALIYLRRHPENVRTVHLHSVLPMDARVPMYLAPHTQAAFEKMAAACAAEPACHAAFPDPKADLETVLKRLEAKPAKSAETPWLTRNGAAQTVRYLLYRPAGARSLPLLLRLAASGNLEPLAQTAWDIASAMLVSSPGGLYLSVTCAEDVAFMDPAEAARLAGGTFMGDLRVRQQVAACAEWPAAKVPASFLEPVRSSVPVLIYSGENDPTTPREWAEKVAQTLTASRILTVPGGAHVFYNLPGVECLDRVYSDFLARGRAEGLDLETCRKSIRPLPFLMSFE